MTILDTVKPGQLSGWSFMAPNDDVSMDEIQHNGHGILGLKFWGVLELNLRPVSYHH